MIILAIEYSENILKFQDGKITKEEMLEKWDVFVGSNDHGSTSFSDIINGERDELWSTTINIINAMIINIKALVIYMIITFVVV